jgi:hypothetical protein
MNNPYDTPRHKPSITLKTQRALTANPTSRVIFSAAPRGKSIKSGNFAPDGTPLWITIPWPKGELAEYCRTVLNREPSSIDGA